MPRETAGRIDSKCFVEAELEDGDKCRKYNGPASRALRRRLQRSLLNRAQVELFDSLLDWLKSANVFLIHQKARRTGRWRSACSPGTFFRRAGPYSRLPEPHW
jgi:hypothetical protein